jgi:hypothetical protein
MLGRKRILRVIAVLSVAVAAGQTVETLRAPGQAQGQSAAAADARNVAIQPGSSLPSAASLASGTATGLPDLAGITPVSAAAEARENTECAPSMALSVLDGAMIDLVLDAPCNPGERVVIRHSGLSFTARTGAEGQLSLRLPALEAEALVAAYFDGSKVALAEVMVPEIAGFTRFAVQAAAPLQFDLRVIDGGTVYSGTGAHAMGGGDGRIVLLGTQSVTGPITAQVYTFPAGNPGNADLTVEVRITEGTCSRTLPVETLLSNGGLLTPKTHAVSMPLCGTAGDILVLKNLVPAPKLAVPN